MENEGTEYIGRVEAAQLAGCSTATIRRAEGNGIETTREPLSGPGGTFRGTRVLLLKADVLKWADARSKVSSSPAGGPNMSRLLEALRRGQSPPAVAVAFGVGLGVVMDMWQQYVDAMQQWSADRDRIPAEPDAAPSVAGFDAQLRDPPNLESEEGIVKLTDEDMLRIVGDYLVRQYGWELPEGVPLTMCLNTYIHDERVRAVLFVDVPPIIPDSEGDGETAAPPDATAKSAPDEADFADDAGDAVEGMQSYGACPQGGGIFGSDGNGNYRTPKRISGE